MRPRRCRLRRRRPRAFPGRQPSSLRQVLLDSPACAERLRGAAPPLLAPPIRVLAYYHVCLRGDRGGGARVGGAGGDTPLTVFRLLRGARAASEPERGGGSLGEEQGALRATACVSHASAKTIHPTAAPSTAPIPRRRSPRVHTPHASQRRSCGPANQMRRFHVGRPWPTRRRLRTLDSAACTGLTCSRLAPSRVPFRRAARAARPAPPQHSRRREARAWAPTGKHQALQHVR